MIHIFIFFSIFLCLSVSLPLFHSLSVSHYFSFSRSLPLTLSYFLSFSLFFFHPLSLCSCQVFSIGEIIFHLYFFLRVLSRRLKDVKEKKTYLMLSNSSRKKRKKWTHSISRKWIATNIYFIIWNRNISSEKCADNQEDFFQGNTEEPP